MKNKRQLIGAILIIALLFSFNTKAQSPFHRLPKPSYATNPFKPIPHADKLSLFNSPGEVSAFRFTGPIAGYDLINNKVVTGVGYGLQKLHWIDSTQKYYADFSLSGIVFAGGNATPSITQNNIVSVGIGAGFLNQLLLVAPVYNLPLIEGTKGKFGLVVSISVALNN